MRPLVFFSILAAKRLSHSCWASLRVAVASLTTIALLSCAAALAAPAAARPEASALAITAPLKCLPMRLSPSNGLGSVRNRSREGKSKAGQAVRPIAARMRVLVGLDRSLGGLVQSADRFGGDRSVTEHPMKKLVLETTAPFQGLPELVAYDEGLFAAEGLTVEWADREKGVEKKVDTAITSPKGVNPFASHGKLLEQGQADMY